jgi:hypothetical protein
VLFLQKKKNLIFYRLLAVVSIREGSEKLFIKHETIYGWAHIGYILHYNIENLLRLKAHDWKSEKGNSRMPLIDKENRRNGLFLIINLSCYLFWLVLI